MFKLLRFVVLPIAVGLGVYFLANPLRGTLVERDLPLPYHIPKFGLVRVHAGWSTTERLGPVVHTDRAPRGYRQKRGEPIAGAVSLLRLGGTKLQNGREGLIKNGQPTLQTL
jgi:hypothetical protein